MTTRVTDDEHIDVAADIVVAPRIRAKHEREVNACLSLENRAHLSDETDGSCVEVTEGRIQRIRRIHPPHSQRTYAPTFDEPLPEQLLERELYRPRAAVDPPNEIACMKLLARRTRQQREQAGLGRRPLDIGHAHNDTSVSEDDTDVFPLGEHSSPVSSRYPRISKSSKADLVVLKELIDAGKITPVIYRTYPLSETAAAIRYLQSGHARAKVVITM